MYTLGSLLPHFDCEAGIRAIPFSPPGCHENQLNAMTVNVEQRVIEEEGQKREGSAFSDSFFFCCYQVIQNLIG